MSELSSLRLLSTLAVAVLLIGAATAGALEVGDRSAATVAVGNAAFYGATAPSSN